MTESLLVADDSTAVAKVRMGFGWLRLSWILATASFIAVVVAAGLYGRWILAPVQLPRPPGGVGDYFPPKTPSILCRQLPSIGEPLATWRKVAEWRGGQRSTKTASFAIHREGFLVFVGQEQSMPGALETLNVLIYLANGEFGCALPSLYGTDEAWFAVRARGRFYLELGVGGVHPWTVEVYERAR